MALQTLKEWMDREEIPAAVLARELGCSRSYITHVRNDAKPFSHALAIKLYATRKVLVQPMPETLAVGGSGQPQAA